MVLTRAKFLFLLIFGLEAIAFSSVSAQAVTPEKLSLQDAIRAALTKNTALKIAGTEIKIATSGYRQTNAAFLPSIEVSYSAITTNNPLNVFGFKLQQARVTAADFNPDLLNNPTHTEDYSAKIEVQQPLLNLDMIFQRNAAEKQKRLADFQYQRAREFVEFDTHKAYLNLQVACKAVTILEESLSKAREITASTERFSEQGLLKKSDVLNARVQAATIESQLSKANSMILNASGHLAVLMGSDNNAGLMPDSLALENDNTDTASQQVSFSRSDLMATKTAIEASKMMVKSEQMNMLPRINAFGSFQYNDSQLARFNANSYLIGIKLSWTVFNGTKSYHAIQSRKSELTKLELEFKQQQDQSQLELNKAQRDRTDALAEINRQNTSVSQASESLRILQNRFNEGLVSSTDLLAAQMQLLQQKMNLAQAVYNHNLTLAYLQFLTKK